MFGDFIVAGDLVGDFIVFDFAAGGETDLRLVVVLFGWRTIGVLFCLVILVDEFLLKLFLFDSCELRGALRVTLDLAAALFCCLIVFLEIDGAELRAGVDLRAGADLVVCCLVWLLLERLFFLAAAKMESLNKSRPKTSIINAIFVRQRRFNEFCRFFGVNMISLLSSIVQQRLFFTLPLLYILGINMVSGNGNND